jgi:hypothetical protein
MRDGCENEGPHPHLRGLGLELLVNDVARAREQHATLRDALQLRSQWGGVSEWL